MFVHESGSLEGPSIVFLHGNGANGSMWKSHMERLADFHCLAPDFPGFGQSRSEEWISLDATTDQVIQLVQDRTAQDQVHIVGLSLGGSVAMTWLGKAPQFVDHAIVDGAGVQPLPGLPLMKIGFGIMQPFLHNDFVIRIIAGMMKIPAEDYEEFKKGMLLMSPSSFTRSFLQASSMELPPGLQEVTCRVLFVAGEKEPQAVKQSQASLAGLLSSAESCIAPGMGHGWLAEAPDLHCRMIRRWIQEEQIPTELVRSVKS
ncbi:MAG: alpha/beta fold hydrolase [Syntrophobacteria bacterium]